MHEGDHSHQPVLIMAFRGLHANSVWQEITGPSDPQLARRTDPASINALYCHGQDQPLLYSPRLASLVHLGLCLWFGGRIAKNSLSMLVFKCIVLLPKLGHCLLTLFVLVRLSSNTKYKEPFGCFVHIMRVNERQTSLKLIHTIQTGMF